MKIANTLSSISYPQPLPLSIYQFELKSFIAKIDRRKNPKPKQSLYYFRLFNKEGCFIRYGSGLFPTATPTVYSFDFEGVNYHLDTMKAEAYPAGARL